MTTLSYHHHCRGSTARRLPLSFFSNLLATTLLLSCCSTSRRNSSLMIVVGVHGADVVEVPQHRQQQLLEPPDDYVDDIYHCDNPLDTENNIISCNFVTFDWVVTDLVPDSPPQECDDNVLLAAAISTEGFQDRDEPCVLWYLMYGVPTGDTYIAPSPFYNEENIEAPTQAPIAAPTQAPLAAVTDQPSGTFIPFVPDDTSSDDNVQQQDNPLHKAIGPFTLTYIWPEKNNRSFAYELNRSELHTITSRHILEALQAELGLSNVKHVNLILTPSQPSPRTRTETLTGNVVLLDFNDEQQPNPSTVTTTMITQQQLQQIVAAAFQGNAMELYLFRLQIAKDMALRNIIQVILGTDGSNLSPQDNNNNQNGNDNNGDDELDSSSFFADNILLITISLSAVAAILALCCFVYCLLVSGRRRKSGRNEKDEMNNKSNTSKGVVPAISTKPTNSQEDVIGVVLGGGDGNLHVSGGDHSPPPQTIPGDDEENRSLYSYLNNNDDDALSAAPSFLFSVHEADICQDDSGSSNNNTATEADKSLKNRQKRGVLWSVMDSFHSAFVNGDDDDDVDDYDNDGVSPLSIKEETSSKPKFFGEQEEPREKSNPSGIMYKGVLYSEEGTDDDNRSALTFDDNKSMLTYDYDLTVGINGILNDDERSTLAAQTPVRQRFEALWKEDDEKDHVRDYLPTTVKKSNRTMQVYEDDDEEEASGGLNVSTDTADASDDSPHTLLTQASRNPNTNTLLKKDQPILVDRTPETDSEEEEEEEDSKLPLPSAILVGTSKGSNHQGDDTYHSETDSIGSNQSINSGKSNQSNGSSRSYASSRPRFQPTNSTAASAKDIGSARKQRTSQWGGGGATKMYPSFLYQSTSDNQSIGSLKSSATNASQKSHFTIQSTDSAKFRSLLNQEDTNDAALFNMTQSINTSGSTENSNLMATKLSYGDSAASPASKSSVSSSNKAVTTTAAAPSQVSTLIQSFDKVWNDDEDDTDKENDSTTDNKNAMQPLRFEHLCVDMSYDKKNGGDDASTVASVYASPSMASF